MPLRVGLVIGQLTAGGAEGQLAALCAALDRTQIVPTVYCLRERTEPYGAVIAAGGTPVRCVGGGRLTRLRRLRQWLAADAIDVVHAWLFIANGYAWAANWGSARPLVTSARNCKVQGRASQLANVIAFRASGAVVVNSQDVARYIARHYRAPRERLRVVYNGIDVERFRPATSEPAAPAGAIVTVGRLVPQKNHALFLEAAARLHRDLPQARFVIIGDGPLRATLEQQARDLELGAHLQFAGERRDVDALLRGAALFWLTSSWEGMPNAVLEAMASGVPVIATDVGGTRELIRPGVDGFVVPGGDAGAFVEQSRLLLRDAERWRGCAAAARRRAEVFSTRRMAAALSQLYVELARRK